jgi:hypothetical protein
VIRHFDLETAAEADITQYTLDCNGAQIEAVCIIDENHVWITSEQTRKYPAFLAKISI